MSEDSDIDDKYFPDDLITSMRGLFGSDEMLAIALTRDGHPTKKSEVDNLCKERPEWLTKWARKEWKFRLDATEANLKRLKLIPEDAKRG